MSATLLERPSAASSTLPRRGRLLLVAYCFPPVGGAGVQRPVKWVKYLHRAGWDVTVLTPANPSVPVRDESLLAEVPDETVFLRPRTWEPDYHVKAGLAAATKSKPTLLSRIKRTASNFAKAALQPDPQVLWFWNAVRAAGRHLTRTPHDAILCTAPPYSSFLIGRALKRRFGLPLVLDYRDEWDMSSRYLEHAQRDWFSRVVQERMQRQVLAAADAVVATTQASADRLAERLHAIGSKTPTHCLYNGFDAEDFMTTDEPQPSSDRFRLVYTGTLWNLTTIEPLVEAIQSLNESRPEAVSRLELVCVGRKTPEQTAVLERLKALGCCLELHDYCAHDDVLAWQRSADALCLLLSDVPGAERVVPAKLFEYLAARKDLLAIVPDGEAAGIVERFHPDGRCAPRDVGRIRGWLESRLSARSEAPLTLTLSPEAGARGPEEDEIQEFSRERQTGRLIDVLESLTAARKAGPR